MAGLHQNKKWSEVRVSTLKLGIGNARRVAAFNFIMSTVLNFASAVFGLAFAKSLADSRERRKNSVMAKTVTAASVREIENEAVLPQDDDAFDIDAAVAEWVVVLYSIFTIFPSLYMFLVEK